jgi:hypothetical protein
LLTSPSLLSVPAYKTWMKERGMKIIATIGVLLGLVLVSAPAVLAKDGDVIRHGPCSGAGDWKLKLSPENGKIEVEFEVDQNRVGDTWTVVLKREGVRFFKGERVTRAPSGSFEVRRVISNQSGPDTVVGKATNERTGELCRGSATF